MCCVDYVIVFPTYENVILIVAPFEEACFRTVFEDLHARCTSSFGQPQGIVQRMKMPALWIINPAMIATATDMLPDILGLDDLRLPAKFICQKLGIALHRVEMGRLVGSLQMPGLQIALDVMFLDPVLHPINRAIGQIENRLRPFAAKLLINLAHRPAQPGDQLPAVAA